MTSVVKMKVLHWKEFDKNSPNLSIIDQLCNFFKMIFDLQGQFSKLTATNFQLRSYERLSFLLGLQSPEIVLCLSISLCQNVTSSCQISGAQNSALERLETLHCLQPSVLILTGRYTNARKTARIEKIGR